MKDGEGNKKTWKEISFVNNNKECYRSRTKNTYEYRTEYFGKNKQLESQQQHLIRSTIRDFFKDCEEMEKETTNTDLRK